MEILIQLKNDLMFIEICEMIDEEILGDINELGVEDLTGKFDNQFGLFTTEGKRRF